MKLLGVKTIDTTPPSTAVEVEGSQETSSFLDKKPPEYESCVQPNGKEGPSVCDKPGKLLGARHSTTQRYTYCLMYGQCEIKPSQ